MKIGLTGRLCITGFLILSLLFDLVLLVSLTGRAFRRSISEFNRGGGHFGGSEIKKNDISLQMRRLKETVLKELPEKIEDMRNCKL
jgi:hypothetical protein